MPIVKEADILCTKSFNIKGVSRNKMDESFNTLCRTRESSCTTAYGLILGLIKLACLFITNQMLVILI